MPDVEEPLFTKRHTTWVLVLVLLCVLFWFLPPLAARQDEIYRTFTPLVAVKGHIQKRYVEEVGDTRLVEGAIRGMLRELDEHSSYLSRQQYAVFVEQAQGGYVGIGVQIEQRNAELVVQSPLEGSPALAAGVRSGDVIIEVSGIRVDPRDLSSSAERLRGLEGSMAHFKVRRPPDDELISFSVKRGRIKTRSVRGFRRRDDAGWDYMIDPDNDIGYIRVADFWDNTLSEFQEAVDELQKAQVRALILDVRFNPGGDMDAAIGLVDRFLSHGTILMTKNRREVQSSWEATAANTLPDWPVVVLVNSVSASGAEILAGALQDHGRAAVVGQRSYGKGSVQSLIPMADNQSALRLTTAYYYLPSNRCIHRRSSNQESDEWGIIPDHVLETSFEEMNEIFESWLRSAIVKNSESGELKSILIDKQLHKALDVVRAQLADNPL